MPLSPEERAERNAQMVEEHEGGATIASLAKKYDLSRERARQIIRREQARAERQAQRDALWGRLRDDD